MKKYEKPAIEIISVEVTNEILAGSDLTMGLIESKDEAVLGKRRDFWEE